MSTEPNTGLTRQEPGSLTTDALHNQVVELLGVWLNCAVQSVGDTVPPGSPVNGHRYIVGASATGAWATHDDELAIYRDGWQFYAPPAAGVPIVKNLDDGNDYERVAGAWSAKSAGGSGTLDGLSDVDITGRADGDLLAWDAGASKWVPVATSGGGGALEKLADFTVTTAQRDIDFTGVDLDADAKYVVELAYVPVTTGDHTISLYYNADLTGTNYRATLFYSDGPSAVGFSINSAYAFSCGNSLTPKAAFAKFEIGKVVGHKPFASVAVCGPAFSGGGVRSMLNGHEWGNTANVTSIKLRHVNAGGFGIGTRARLYRLN